MCEEDAMGEQRTIEGGAVRRGKGMLLIDIIRVRSDVHPSCEACIQRNVYGRHPAFGQQTLKRVIEDLCDSGRREHLAHAAHAVLVA